jgi:predicted MFS family arabinose efflux permease
MQSDWMHKWMVIIAVLVLVISLLLHQLSPADELYVLVATTALGFLFGKATNGIGKRRDEDGDEA